MTNQYDITKQIHRNNFQDIKVCVYYDECRRVSVKGDEFVYKNISRTQLPLMSSFVCSQHQARWTKDLALSREQISFLEKESARRV